MPVAAAIIGGAALTGGLGYFSAANAAGKQAESAQNALNFQQSIYRNARDDLSPYMDLGKGASGTLAGMYGFPGSGREGAPADYSAFYNSPEYGFSMQQGLRALDASSASKGLLLSGGQVRAAQNFGQGLASQQFGNYFNRMLSLSQLGSSAAAALTGNATNQGNMIGNTMMGIGQAQASGLVGGANAISGSVGNAINNLTLYSSLNRSPSAYGNVGGGAMNIVPPQVGSLSTGTMGGTGGGLGGYV